MARFLGKEFFTFTATHRLWIAANDRPAISADDGAMWERLRQIPFEQQLRFAREDLSEEAYTAAKTEGAQKQAEVLDVTVTGLAILAWAVQGCLAWQCEGLGYPEEVQEATDDYRDEMRSSDLVAQFMDEMLEVGPDWYVLAKSVETTYNQWATRRGEHIPMRQRTLNARLIGLQPKLRKEHTTRDGDNGLFLFACRLRDVPQSSAESAGAWKTRVGPTFEDMLR